MPSLSRIEQQEQEAFVSAIERRALPLSEQFRARLSGPQPKGLEKPTRRELVLLTVPVLLLPLTTVLLVFHFFMGEEFEDISIGKRILMLPAALVLYPCAMLVVLYGHVMRPMVKRIRVRREALREAERALHELTRTIPGIRTIGTKH